MLPRYARSGDVALTQVAPPRHPKLVGKSAIITPMTLHGEYKTPGGKLVVVDLRVEGGLLAGVEVSGDFFLEPAEALEDIVNALEGAPATKSTADLAARIDKGVREGAHLIGFDSTAVALAVRRAVEDGGPRERA